MTALGPLRFVYMGSEDVDADVRFHVQALGGDLRWFLDRFGARAACVRHASGPDLVFTSHMPKDEPLFLFASENPSVFDGRRGARHAATPVGPAVIFRDMGGRRIGAIKTREDDYLEKAWKDTSNPGAVVFDLSES